ncbi:MAG: biotin/lipoyl-binding protein, partial [Candidatus Marinimicrobia bacterium]|nr:biotin/lipoyl-binding protein [Candidatus Neomarinimicrobiota bacterium]
MKTFSLKSVSLPLVLALVLVSCGAPGAKKADKDINYHEVLSGIRALTEDLPADVSKTEARRYLAGVQKILIPVSNAADNNDLTIVPVNVRTVEAEYIAQKVQYLGNVGGNPSVVIYPKLTDIMMEVAVENGDYVRKGEVLARISDATVRTAKAQAEAAWFSAKSQAANVEVEYERMKQLFDANAISRSQWDQILTQRDMAKAGLSQAKAALDMAETQLSYS